MAIARTLPTMTSILNLLYPFNQTNADLMTKYLRAQGVFFPMMLKHLTVQKGVFIQ